MTSLCFLNLLIWEVIFPSWEQNEYTGRESQGDPPYLSGNTGIEEAVFFSFISTAQYWRKTKNFDSLLRSLISEETDPLVAVPISATFSKGNVTKYFKITKAGILCLSSSPSRNILQMYLEVCSGKSVRAKMAAL